MKAKNMKSKIINKLCSFFGKPKVSLSGLTRQSFLLILLLILASCSNLLTKDLEQTSDGNTYLVIRPDSISIDARTIQAKEEYALANLTSITLDATKSDSTKENLASSIGSLSELYAKQFLLTKGEVTYTFELKGQLDGVYFYQKREGIKIEESKANTISFTLSPVKDSSDFSEFEGFGGLSVEMNFSTTNVSGINITLKDMSNRMIDQKTITSLNSGKVTYNRLAKNTSGTEARIPVGTYRLNIEFYTKDTTLGSNVIINSYPYLVKIEKGQNAYLKENFDLTSVHTISYNNISGASPAPGQRMRTKFTSKDEFMLPRMQKDGYAFMGWYKTSDYSGDVYERIESNTSENQRFYAKFMSSTIYVDAEGDDEKDGDSSTNALKTLSKAVEKITEANDSEREWYIYMSGEFTEPQTIAGNFNSENNYRETIPAKAINILGNNAILHSTPTVTALTIMTETPVTLRDIEIDGNYTGNTGIAMGFDEQTYESINSNVTLGSGVYVHENLASDVYVINGKVNLYGFVRIDRLNAEGTDQVVLLDDLSSDASITIMLQNYDGPRIWESEVSKTQLVLFDKNIINFASNNAYFHVPPESTPDGTVEWFIDEEGCLNKECTISFTGEGATSMSDVSVGMYTPISPDDSQFQISERSGYEFAGWYYLYDETRYNGSENVHVRYIMNPFDFKDSADDSEFTHIESDMTLYAAWRKLGLSDIYVNANTGADGVYVEIDDKDTIYFGDGTEEHPLRTVEAALDLIKLINNPSADYTINISGLTSEYNLVVDDNLPVNSLTFKGISSAETDGIDCTGQALDNFNSVLQIATAAPVVIQNMKVKLALWSYEVDGAVMNVGSGSTVTLKTGTIFEGSGNSNKSKGAVAIEDDGTLIMEDGVTFKNFEIKGGAVNVKTGGTFTMNGGTFENNSSDGTCGAVYVNGGTFTMNDGYIKNNMQDAFQRDYLLPQGAGVCVASGTFIMEGGHITNNESYGAGGNTGRTTAGGGVFVYANGEFIMRGGEITNNHAYNKLLFSNGNVEDDSTSTSYGGGVCLQASGNKLASFTMTGGTISGNTAGTSGNGIGFLGSLAQGATGSISLGAGAIITDNDIYLPSNVTITIIEQMTGGLTPSIRATITPQEYTANHPILNNEGVSLENEYDYFAVTPQSDGTITTHWFIDENGKLYKYSVGDLLLTDGTFVYYDESHTFSEDEVSATVGLVYGLDEEGKPRGILGLKNSSGASPYIATPWAPQSSSGNSIKFEDIICTPSNDGDTVSFTGDTDGSDNWDYICEIDQVGSADSATNYPAFNYVLNYVATAGLTDSDYDSGWYMPSASEMYDIYKNLTTINSVLTKIKAVTSDSANTLTGLYFWTSSQADAAGDGNSAWYINITATSNPFTSSNKDWDSPSVCCIHKYEKQ